jgi:hypothetical protein
MVKANGKAWISDADFRALCKYVEQLAALLNLQDWVINVSRHALNDQVDDSLAECAFRSHYKDVEMRFRSDFMQMPADERRQNIVHELIHIHTRSLWKQADTICKRVAGEDQYQLIYDLLDHSHEQCVEELARSIAPLLPPYPHAILKNRSRKS